ncbi:MAG: Transcriptional regulatory protein ZraR [Deltaproteobacteria bacterium ADurb.Bin510]|nr:MAG: Transcriptional regulatory protein ZraR [Deltaproteobacteria bacterium ADurb.Bin510]
MGTINILIVDSDRPNREYLAELLNGRSLCIETADDARDALNRITGKAFQVMIIALDDQGGLETMQQLLEAQPESLPIIYTDQASVKLAVEAMKQGAFDYLQKPFRAEDLRASLDEALGFIRRRQEKTELGARLKERYNFDKIVGESEKMAKVFKLIGKIASSESTVLVLGESGTGKELAARAIHYNSARSDGPFVPVNCGAIPEELLESELFGHEKGAFTGAFRTRIGRFELAAGGSIFLDEIAEMSPNLQVKLLRVIQEREFERVGGARTLKADVRLIAATNKNLEEEVAKGRFREDLYYRLNVIPLNLPPLRERNGDIELLAEHFVTSYAASHPTCTVAGFSPEALSALKRYRWPGNVRELENLIERMAVLCEGPLIELSDLPEKFTNLPPQERISGRMSLELPEDGLDLAEAVGEFERNIILQALNRTDWVKNRAAQLLNLNRTTLVEKIKKQNLTRPSDLN